jgi:hypothetical protein
MKPPKQTCPLGEPFGRNLPELVCIIRSVVADPSGDFVLQGLHADK